MDIFSHAAWGATIIREPEKIGWAALSGALPDLLPAIFGILKFRINYSKRLREMSYGQNMDKAYLSVYRFFHSFVPISVVTVILYFIAPNYWFITLPYYLHIILDIFTHEHSWATQIFYPFSNWHFKSGINWWQHYWVSLINWSALIVINIILFV